MKQYEPPFTITNIMLDRISSIMKKIGKLDNYKDLNKMPVLRRNNRIKSIHSSLAIEANSLSINQVKDIIDGKVVSGPKNEIQEVQNAYNAYLKMNHLFWQDHQKFLYFFFLKAQSYLIKLALEH